MAIIKNNDKVTTLRMKKDLWLFLRELSIKQERSMNMIICETLEKLKKYKEKKVDDN